MQTPLVFISLFGQRLTYINGDRSRVVYNSGQDMNTEISSEVMRGGKHSVTFRIEGGGLFSLLDLGNKYGPTTQSFFANNGLSRSCAIFLAILVAKVVIDTSFDGPVTMFSTFPMVPRSNFCQQWAGQELLKLACHSLCESGQRHDL